MVRKNIFFVIKLNLVGVISLCFFLNFNLYFNVGLMKKRLRTLHLTAGAVMATVQYYELTGLDPVGKLASITRVPATFITCIADFIIKYLDEEDLPYLPMPRKRKFSEV